MIANKIQPLEYLIEHEASSPDKFDLYNDKFITPNDNFVISRDRYGRTSAPE